MEQTIQTVHETTESLMPLITTIISSATLIIVAAIPIIYKICKRNGKKDEVA